jgi:hypothetical protein
MTAKQAIEKLKKMDPDTEVFCRVEHHINGRHHKTVDIPLDGTFVNWPLP